jgi:hypothetical protein
MTDITFCFCYYSLFSLLVTVFVLLSIKTFFSFCSSLQAEATEEESSDEEEGPITEADSDIIEEAEWSSTKYKMASD